MKITIQTEEQKQALIDLTLSKFKEFKQSKLHTKLGYIENVFVDLRLNGNCKIQDRWNGEDVLYFELESLVDNSYQKTNCGFTFFFSTNRKGELALVEQDYKVIIKLPNNVLQLFN